MLYVPDYVNTAQRDGNATIDDIKVLSALRLKKSPMKKA